MRLNSAACGHAKEKVTCPGWKQKLNSPNPCVLLFDESGPKWWIPEVEWDSTQTKVELFPNAALLSDIPE